MQRCGGHIPEEMSPQPDRYENPKTQKIAFLNWWGEEKKKAIHARALRVSGG